MKFAVLLYIPSDYLSTFCNKNECVVTKIKIFMGEKKVRHPMMGCGWGGSWNMLKSERKKKAYRWA